MRLPAFITRSLLQLLSFFVTFLKSQVFVLVNEIKTGNIVSARENPKGLNVKKTNDNKEIVY